MANADLLAAMDQFIATPKRLVGTHGPVVFRQGYNRYERKTHFPIEIEGELDPAARLEIIGMPDVEEIQFRISLCYNAALVRLDHTNEDHPNTDRIDADNLPPDVSGPHYHSWPINRRFFRGAASAPELRNAVPFDSRGSFESNLRWFCGQVNIEQPDGLHVIELPRKTRLL